MAAAYRHLGHWSELIGGDIVLTIPYEWQVKINASDIPVVERMQNPVAPQIVEALYAKIPDFRRAYDADGMAVDEFELVRRHRAHAARVYRRGARPDGGGARFHAA